MKRGATLGTHARALFPAMQLPIASLLIASLLVACGEKIAIPDAVGIPVDSDYVEQRAWDLTDPVDVLETNGRIFVIEGTPGILAKYNTRGELIEQVVGLADPAALSVEFDVGSILVAENGNGSGPAVSMYDIGDLSFVGRVDLTGIVTSASGITSDGQFVYLSDREAGVVHRLAWTSEPEGWLTPQGIVCSRAGSRESPQFVFEPAGLSMDLEGSLLVCDSDTTRNWVLRFDPLPPENDPEGNGRARAFREIPCPVPPVASFVLGDAPGCGEPFVAGPSEEPGGFDRPRGIAVDVDGRLYVADADNGRVQRFGPDGVFDIVFGDGKGGVASLGEPCRVTTWLGITSRGGTTIIIPGARVYVVDRASAQIRVFEDRRWQTFQDDV